MPPTRPQQGAFDAKVLRMRGRGAEREPLSPTHVRAGLDYRALEDIAERLGVRQDVIASVLGTSSRTLRRRRAQRLSAVESDRLWRVKHVFGLAMEAFEGDADEARAWLTAPKQVLGGETPLTYLDTEAGARRVEQLLAAMTYLLPG